MNQEFLNLKDQEILYSIRDYLAKISVEATVMEASENMPYNLLIASTKERVPINIMYVPLPEDHFATIRLLQHYSLITARVNAERKSDLLSLLNEINNQSPLGSFAINEQGELGFKYIYPVPRFGMLNEESFMEVFSLYLNCLLSFRSKITQVNNGTLSPGDALKK